ncbi:hypothetical protein [Brazilian marseillevirus]|uniref:hypothetical protein n=1 Tax=Brazilian marseillevirus TaxID=1813599 RepID=UPI0007827350|nr:hypothetical protein A3303_gp350 [Brazilian marseillevirus]AMQ10858.1 hypothetical protein [Brazilian marseillevirus]
MLDTLDPNALVLILGNVSLQTLLFVHKVCPNRRDVCDYVFEERYSKVAEFYGVPKGDWTSDEYIASFEKAMGPKKFSDIFLGPLTEAHLTRCKRLAKDAEEIANRIFSGPLKRKRMDDLRVLSCWNPYGHGVKDGDVLDLCWKIFKYCSEDHNETRQEIFRILRQHSKK